MSVTLVEQLRDLCTAYKRSIGDYHEATEGPERARAAVAIRESYRALVRGAWKAGVRDKPPRPVGDWGPWLDSLEDWWADAEAQLSPDDDQVPLLERVLAVLTPNQVRIMKHLWKQKTASYKTLKEIPGAFRVGVTEVAITKQLKAMRTRLEQNGILNVYIKVSDAAERVNLTRPPE
jgi:hypothetical protein